MKNKKLIIILAIILLTIISIIFIKNMAKKSENGNNITSQEIINKILNISSYEVEIEATITSNKNQNTYKINQKYKNPDFSSQTVIEPKNIEGTEIIREKEKITLKNTKLNLTKIIEEYPEIAENNLDLSTFISEYTNNEKKEVKENENEIILKVEVDKNNSHIKEKELYIDKKNIKPIKMIIYGTNKKEIIYISYNKVKIN